MAPRKFDQGERPFNKFRDDKPRRVREGGDERPFRKPFTRDSRPPFDDDEQFTATGELADIVGTHPLDRREILRRMWRHYQDAGLVKSMGGGTRPPRTRTDRPPRDRDERAPRRFEGERGAAGPRRYERTGTGPARKSGPRGEGAPRRFERDGERGERRPARDRDEGPRKYARKPSTGPRVSTRTPSGKHPAGKRADALSKVPRRKFKETRERNDE